MRQRFHSPKDYKPKVYGYRQAQDTDDERLVHIYGQLRGFDQPTMIVEPHSARSLSGRLRKREGGAKLISQLRPGDHVIAASWTRMFVDREDFVAGMRWFMEHGVNVHVCDYMGTPLDLCSRGGRIVLETLLHNAELDILQRRLLPRKKAVRELHNGKQIPWFVAVHDGNLMPSDTAMEIVDRAVRLRDQERLPWGRISALMYEDWERLTGKKLAANKGKTKEAVDAYCFYKGWEELGFPDLNTISLAQVKNDYKAKLFKESGDDRDAVAGADG